MIDNFPPSGFPFGSCSGPEPVERRSPVSVILPTIALGLDEIFVTDGPSRTGDGKPSGLGDFMPVLEVTLVRRGQRSGRAVFSLS